MPVKSVRRDDLFKRLTSLFRGGPSVKRKVKAFRQPSASTAVEVFKKSYSQVYSNALNAYGQYDRMSRYADFSEMEYTPEISSALDIYCEESTSSDDKGGVLHVYSENEKIKELLDELFHDTLNCDHNLTPWTRNLCKYGDFFLFIDVHPELGVINAFPMPVNEVEREEGWDPQDPLAVRFRWVTQGNQILEAWQVAHFRLMGNDAFLPYGSSILESARRIWRQLILIEDAMLVYRVVRSPERRVFYIDVGTVPTEEIPNYMEAAQTKLKRSQVIDKGTGRVDLRYNPLSVDEDYFIPVRGSETGTKIDTLAGGQHVSDIADVEYIQKKLFAALKVPKAYLGYDEALSSKATLAQEDIRFSRSIMKIQRVLISELEKLAIIHLYAHGYEGEDLADFSLFLSNPSTIAQQQKLELYRTKFEIAGTVPDGLVDRSYIRKNILMLSDDDIDEIEEGRRDDRMIDLELEAEELEGNAPPSGGGGGIGGLGAGGPGDIGGDEEDITGAGGGEGPEGPGGTPGEEEAPAGEEEDLFASDTPDDGSLITDEDLATDDGLSLDDALATIDKKNGKRRLPVKSTNQLKRYAFNRGRRRTHGPRATHMPNFGDMTSFDADPNDRKFFSGSPFKESVSLRNSLLDDDLGLVGKRKARVSVEMKRVLASLGQRIDSIKVRTSVQARQVLTESDDFVVDVTIEDDMPLGDILVESGNIDFDATLDALAEGAIEVDESLLEAESLTEEDAEFNFELESDEESDL